MLEERYHRAVDMIFPIIDGYIDRATKFEIATSLADAHCMYSDLMYKVMPHNYDWDW